MERLLEPEYEWILRICANAFNVYMTMVHFTFYDNAVNLRQPNTGKFEINVTRKRHFGEIEVKRAQSKVLNFRNLLLFVHDIHDRVGSLLILHLSMIGRRS